MQVGTSRGEGGSEIARCRCVRLGCWGCNSREHASIQAPDNEAMFLLPCSKGLNSALRPRPGRFTPDWVT